MSGDWSAAKAGFIVVEEVSRGVRGQASGLAAEARGAGKWSPESAQAETSAAAEAPTSPAAAANLASEPGPAGLFACGCPSCAKGAGAESRQLQSPLTLEGESLVRLVTPTNTAIDQLLMGAAWADDTIYYNFPAISGDLKSPFNEDQKDVCRVIFDELDHLLDVKFEEWTGAGSPADGPLLTFGNIDVPAYGGLAEYPDAVGPGSEIWISSHFPDSLHPDPGQYHWNIYLHEIGHALGLKHPFDGFGAFPRDVDYGRFETNLSYSEYGFEHPGAGAVVYAQTFMPLDIQALQHLYGKNQTSDGADTYTVTANDDWTASIRSEDGNASLYDLSCSGQEGLYVASWDSGGADTLTFSGFHRPAGQTAGVRVYVQSDRLSGFLGKLDPDFNIVDNPDIEPLPDPPAIRFMLDQQSWLETIEGSAHDDLLHGAAATRSLLLAGEAGADTLIGGAAADTLRGGAGDDEVFYKAGGGKDVVEGFSVGGADDHIQVIGYSSATYQQVGADTLVVFSTADSLLLKGVTVASLSSADLSFGGTLPEAPPPPPPFDPAPWELYLVGDSGPNLISAGPLADTLFGEAGDDTLNGLAGDDRLHGGDGDDVLNGGAGRDVAEYWAETTSIRLDLSISAAQDTGAGLETINGVEDVLGSNHGDVVIGSAAANYVRGGLGDDSLAGGKGSDTLNGEEGDDTVEGGLGDDTIYGGFGVNTISFAGAEGAVSLDIELGQMSGAEGVDLFFSFANINGGAYGDSLSGDGVDNRLRGADGGDILDGRAGADTIDGEAGDDTVLAGEGADALAGGAGIDTVSFAAAANAVVVDLKTLQASGALGADSISGFERVIGGAGADTISGDDAANTLIGGGGADLLSGLGGADRLDGGDGADTVVGGKGGDTLLGGAGLDTLSYAGVEAALVVNLALNSMTGQVGPDTIGGFETVVGGLGGDRLTGDGGANRLDGGDGDDTILGGGGADALSGGAGADTLSYAGAAAAVTVNLKLQQASGGHGADALSGFEHALGGVAADSITGDGAANRLAGGKGADTLSGGDGADTLLGGDGDDRLNGGAGIDTAVYADVGANLVIDLVAGTAAGAGTDALQGIENIVAGRGDDRLAGDRFANRLEGGRGADQLAGGAGEDVLVGGKDGDRLTGGAGADRFVFLARTDSSSARRDLIADLANGDVVDLSAIDANAAVAGDQAFTLAAAFDGRKGLLVLSYGAKKDLTLIEADIDGDLEADMTILASGDQTSFTNFVL